MFRIAFILISLLATLAWGNYASAWRVFVPPGIFTDGKEAYLVNTQNFILKHHYSYNPHRLARPLFAIAIDPHNFVRSEWVENAFAYDSEHNLFIYHTITFYYAGISGDPEFELTDSLIPYGYLMNDSLDRLKVFESNRRMLDSKWMLQMAKLMVKMRNIQTNEITKEIIYAQYGYTIVNEKTVTVFAPCLSKEELLEYEILSTYPEAAIPLTPNRFLKNVDLLKIPILKNEIRNFKKP